MSASRESAKAAGLTCLLQKYIPDKGKRSGPYHRHPLPLSKRMGEKALWGNERFFYCDMGAYLPNLGAFRHYLQGKRRKLQKFTNRLKPAFCCVKI
jgi:hypothetical protein